MPKKQKKITALVPYSAMLPAVATKKKKKVKKRKVPNGFMNRCAQTLEALLRCVMDPLEQSHWSSGPIRLPTGFGGQTIGFRDIVSIVITPDPDGTIDFVVFPGYPGSLCVFAGGFSCTGQDGNAHVYAVTGSGTTPGIIVPFPDWPPSFDIGSGTHQCFWNARLAKKARPISCGFKVVPTGPPVNVSGQAAIIPHPIELHDFGEKVAAWNTQAVPELVIDGTAYTLPNARTTQKIADVINNRTWATLSTFPGAKVCPVSEACYGNVRIPRSARETFTPFADGWNSDQPTGSFGDTWLPQAVQGATGSTAGICITGNTSGVWGAINPNPPVMMTAPDSATSLIMSGLCWGFAGGECTRYVAQGMPANYPLEVTVALCAEIECDPGSTLRQFQSPGLPRDEVAMSWVDRVIQMMPAAVPAITQGGSLFQSVVNAAPDVAKVLRAAGMALPGSDRVTQLARGLERLAMA